MYWIDVLGRYYDIFLKKVPTVELEGRLKIICTVDLRSECLKVA